MSADQSFAFSVPAAAARRLALGLGQGLLLYLMFKAADLKTWPATNLAIFQGLLLPFLFAPLAAIHADTHLPRRTLIVWLAVVVLVCAGIGLYDGYRFPGPLDRTAWEPGPMLVAVAAGLFLAEALFLAAQTDNRRFPAYPTYFDAVSKHAVQVASAIAFVGALWLLLFLGAALFKLIKLTCLQELLRKEWFAIPATTLAVSVAIHVTDIRPTLVRGLRTLAHSLLSWLMPVLVLIVGGFLASIPFTGLQPLWDTRFAAALLLSVAAVLVVLINAVYQDGAAESQPRGLLRWAMMAALLLPAPLVGIAAYALFLRVAQYGWTAERVIALGCVLVGACFGLGYLAALGRSLKRLETTNVAASFAAIAVLFVMLTPIADPVRISVASQVARLEKGKVSAEAFDYKYLRFEGGRYGAAVLERMQAGEFKVADIAARAKQAAALTARFSNEPIARGDLALNITVAGGTLPESFLAQDWATLTRDKPLYPPCLMRPGARCEAFLIDLDADGIDEVILIQDDLAVAPVVLHSEGAGWSRAGSLPRRLACGDMRALLRAGELRIAPSPWSDIEIGGLRMDLSEQSLFAQADCPKTE